MRAHFRFTAILILAACAATACGARDSRASIRDGAIDLTRNDAARGIVRLDGKWEFYWKKLYTAEDFRAGVAATPLMVKVPSPWNGTVVEGKPIGGFGYATYRLRVTMPWTDDLMGLKVIDAGTACRLYVGDDLVASGGTVSDSEKTYRP